MNPTALSGRQLLLAAALLLSTSLANANLLEFRPQSVTATLGETVAVDVVASNLDGEIVSAYDLDITYDSLILAATGVTFATGLGDALFFEVFESVDLSLPGLIDLAQLSLLPDDLLFAMQGGEELLLATIVFDTLSAGVTALDFIFDAVNDVKTFDAAVLPVTGLSGEIVVQPPPVTVPEPPAWMLLLAGTWYFLFRRRPLSRPGGRP